MSRMAYVNGEYKRVADASVSIQDRGYQFSDGVYEVTAIVKGVPIDFDLHMERLKRSCKEISIALPMPINAMRIVMRELLRKNRMLGQDAVLYQQITRGVATRAHPFPSHTKPSFVMQVFPSRTPAPKAYARGGKVITYPDIRWDQRHIKSVSLLPNVLAMQQAKSKGNDEAWLVDTTRHIVTEASASNAFIIQGNTLRTHPEDNWILSGVTRKVVLKLAAKLKLKVVEKAFTVDEALEADEAFITSTTKGVFPIVEIDKQSIGKGVPGLHTKALIMAYAEHIAETVQAAHNTSL